MTGSEASPATGPHLNQPDGPSHSSALPHVVGRERELRALADAVRRLIDYSRPTTWRRDLVFEGWVDRVESRKVFARGRVLYDGKVTAEATGLFIRVDLETMRRSLDGIG